MCIRDRVIGKEVSKSGTGAGKPRGTGRAELRFRKPLVVFVPVVTSLSPGRRPQWGKSKLLNLATIAAAR